MSAIAPPGVPSEPAVTRLLGLTLDGGWTVVKTVPKRPGNTGGHFSEGYIVEHADGRKGFLKAIDLWRAQKAPDFLRELHELLADYAHDVNRRGMLTLDRRAILTP
jgi:hypothetical protein